MPGRSALLRRLLLAGLLLTAAGQAQGVITFTVNSTNDKADKNIGDGICKDTDGNCTLRAAIQEANANPGTDTIAFGVSGTITVGFSLPDITDPVIIDGTTAPGYAATMTPVVEIRCASQGAFDGLVVSAGSSTVRGLVITQFNNGIDLTTNGGNKIVGNFIGIAADGNTPVANSGAGIRVGSAGNTIGGTGSDRNVVSGNLNFGVAITGTSATGNLVVGNLIGTNADGTAARPNIAGGIYVDSAGNTIGGPAAGTTTAVSTGCAGGSPPPYCPTGNVTRNAMAKFLLLGKHGSTFNPAATTGTVFGDVDVSTLLAKWMERLKAEGITSGCATGVPLPFFCPDGTVTRGEMAKFVRLAFNLP